MNFRFKFTMNALSSTQLSSVSLHTTPFWFLKSYARRFICTELIKRKREGCTKSLSRDWYLLTLRPSLQVVVRVVPSPVVSRLGNVGNFDLPDRVRDFRTTPSYVFWEIMKNLRGLRSLLIAQDWGLHSIRVLRNLLTYTKSPTFRILKLRSPCGFPWPAEAIHMGARISTTIFV
jgi:hypothetical protein